MPLRNREITQNTTDLKERNRPSWDVSRNQPLHVHRSYQGGCHGMHLHLSHLLLTHHRCPRYAFPGNRTLFWQKTAGRTGMGEMHHTAPVAHHRRQECQEKSPDRIEAARLLGGTKIRPSLTSRNNKHPRGNACVPSFHLCPISTMFRPPTTRHCSTLNPTEAKSFLSSFFVKAW